MDRGKRGKSNKGTSLDFNEGCYILFNKATTSMGNRTNRAQVVINHHQFCVWKSEAKKTVNPKFGDNR